ncbi:MAG: VOC family protein [Gammaproteobacteria bacterium]|nr:VOC family protein [Gammaproteobacteria bacterium]
MPNSIHDLYPYVCVKCVPDAISFYTRAFGAEEHFRLTEPSGRVGHAEIRFGANVLMLAEEFPEMGFTAPLPGQAPPSLHLHVDDADRMFDAACKAGATPERPPADQFYGERSCTVRDPFGYRWLIGHSIEEVAVKEMQARYARLFEKA